MQAPKRNMIYVCMYIGIVPTGITLKLHVCASVCEYVVYTIKGTFVEQSSFLISTRTHTDIITI